MMKTEGLFNESFESNKKTLGSNTMPSKKMRNKIAGFMARRIKEASKPVKKKPVEIDIYDKERFQSY